MASIASYPVDDDGEERKVPSSARLDAHGHHNGSSVITVGHDAAFDQLASMFPHLPHEIIACELDQQGRDLEKTISALLIIMEGGEEGQQSAPTDSDAVLAQQLQAELNGSGTRMMNFHAGGDISEEELTRLKLQQFQHRDAIYRSNVEGEFGKKLAAKEADLPLPLRETHEQRRARKLAAALSPMQRIAADRAAYKKSTPNRVADEEELEAAAKGSKALKELHERRAKEQAEVARMEALGWVRQPPASSSTPTVHPSHLNQAALQGVQPSALHSMAAAMAASSSSSTPVKPQDSSHKHHHHKEHRSGSKKSSSKKKKKKDDKDHDKDKKHSKKKKKKDKEKTHSSTSATAATPTSASAIPANPTASSDSHGTHLLDMLPEYSRTNSVSQSIVEESEVFIKKKS